MLLENCGFSVRKTDFLNADKYNKENPSVREADRKSILDFVENVKIIQAKENIVTIRFSEKITKVSGPAFNDTVVDGIMVLRKQSDGSWKVHKDDIISAEALK